MAKDGEDWRILHTMSFKNLGFTFPDVETVDTLLTLAPVVWKVDNSIHRIINNYSPKWRWLVEDIYQAAKRRGK